MAPAADLGSDVPLLERGIEPGIGPAVERAIDVIPVILGKAGTQVTVFEGIARFADSRGVRCLEEEVRRHQYGGLEGGMCLAGEIMSRDRAAVAVTDNEKGLGFDRLYQARQNIAGLIGHVGDRPRQVDRR